MDWLVGLLCLRKGEGWGHDELAVERWRAGGSEAAKLEGRRKR